MKENFWKNLIHTSCKRGRFYNAFSQESFDTYHIKSIESPLITQEFLDSAKQSKSELEYLQEYEGEFLEESDTYFPRQLILDQIMDIPEETRLKIQYDYYLGVDVARYGLDDTVYTVARVSRDGQIHIVFVRGTTKKPITDIVGRVQQLHASFKFRGVYIDASGVGGGAVDSLKEKGIPIRQLNIGKSNTQSPHDGVQFTLMNKEEMYKNLKLLMEQGKLWFPNHKKLIFQLSDLQYEYTEAGHQKIHHPENGHDDYPDSLALAVAALIKRTYKPFIA